MSCFLCREKLQTSDFGFQTISPRLKSTVSISFTSYLWFSTVVYYVATNLFCSDCACLMSIFCLCSFPVCAGSLVAHILLLLFEIKWLLRLYSQRVDSCFPFHSAKLNNILIRARQAGGRIREGIFHIIHRVVK